MKDIQSILEKLEKEMFSNPYWNTAWEDKYREECEKIVKLFISSSIESLLQELRMEEIDIDETREYETDAANRQARNGYNSAVIKINEKIDSIIK